jgi:cupin 2 domain-containing protein
LRAGNLLADLPERLTEEAFLTLADQGGAKIERIVSTGQASPPGFWYDQGWTEWVFLIAGSAALLFEGERVARVLAPGDYLEIPAHVGHRVEWTDAVATDGLACRPSRAVTDLGANWPAPSRFGSEADFFPQSAAKAGIAADRPRRLSENARKARRIRSRSKPVRVATSSIVADAHHLILP